MTDGTNGPDRETYLKHQAIAILDKEKQDAAHKIRKSHRKDAELAGVPLQDMDWVIKTIGMPVGEIAAFFKSKLQLLAFNGVNISAKVDKILGDHTEDQTYAGQLAGMQGKICSPPANFTPHEKQTWIAGWHEGNKARGQAVEIGTAEDAAAAEKLNAAKAADVSTDVVAGLGGEGYGDGDEAKAPGDGEFQESSAEELAAQAGRPSVEAAAAVEPQADLSTASPHQAPKRKAKAAPEKVH